MFKTKKSQVRIRSTHFGALMLTAGVIVGIAIGGIGGVIAASSTSSKIVACANKTTGAMRYSKSGRCTKTETKVSWNLAGTNGTNGTAGTAGAKGDTGTAGTNGTNGTAGTAGAKGETGTAGTNATVAITQLSTCGVGGTSLCKVGAVGPGGGLIFFVDYNDQYTGLNYLEAAPVGWGNAITVNEGGLTGETTGSSTVDPKMKWCSNTILLLELNAWSNSAVGAGASNTSIADTTCAGGAIQAASDYAGGSQSDWFLPSVGEAMLMYTNLRQAGVGGFVADGYWGSSEYNADIAWSQNFVSGGQNNNYKTTTFYVRPVRAF